jgi:hypothetical protein
MQLIKYDAQKESSSVKKAKIRKFLNKILRNYPNLKKLIDYKSP